jgi:hypothetical protein
MQQLPAADEYRVQPNTELTSPQSNYSSQSTTIFGTLLAEPSP